VSKPKQIRLAINLLASGRHDASWKTLEDPARLSTDIDTFVEIAKTAERGLLDGIFLADNYAGLAGESFKRPFRALSPGVLLATLAAHTSRIGLVLTAPALYGNPATLAREIASLDLVSKGRGAWNIITSQHEHSLRLLGIDTELSRSAKYDKADEFVTIVTQLWESLPPSAIVADAASSTYVDAGRLRPVEFQGDYYRAAGVLGVLGGYQGRRPVLLQAGASESSKQFGSRWADALFTSHWAKPSAQEFYRDVKQYAAEKWRRDPASSAGHVQRDKVVASARERGETTRQVLLEYITGGHRIVIGTPEQVADDLIDWIDTDACDGFNFNIDRYTDGLEHLVDRLVPELQARGRFRTEYESSTFRGNLGLPDEPV